MLTAAREAVEHFGRIDTWVNNAGVSIYGRLDEVSDADSRRLFDTNFWGVVNGSLAALPRLKARGGSLINVGSEVSEAVVPLQGIYTASKHAVKRLHRCAPRRNRRTRQGAGIDNAHPADGRGYPLSSSCEKLYGTGAQTAGLLMINPEQVAEAILKAATEGGRDVKVGAMAVVNTAISKLMPSLGDKMSARRGSEQQEEIPPLHPEGTLYRPGRVWRRHGHARL